MKLIQKDGTMITLTFTYSQAISLLIMLPVCVFAVWYMTKITYGAEREAREELIKLRNEIKSRDTILPDPEKIISHSELSERLKKGFADNCKRFPDFTKGGVINPGGMVK